MADRITLTIEELSISDSVSLGRASKSTLYRWAREINDRLENNQMDWRVKALPYTNSLVRIDLNGRRILNKWADENGNPVPRPRPVCVR